MGVRDWLVAASFRLPAPTDKQAGFFVFKGCFGKSRDGLTRQVTGEKEPMEGKNPMGGIVKSAIKNKRYAAIPNEICNDKSLTFGARGLLAYLLSKPENWQVNTYDLVNQSPAGEHAVRGMMNELLTEGYIIRTRTNGPTGHILWVYEVFDTPQETGSPCGDFPNMEKPSMENPNVENHPTYKDRVVKRQIEQKQSERIAHAPIPQSTKPPTLYEQDKANAKATATPDALSAAILEVCDMPLESCLAMNRSQAEGFAKARQFVLSKCGGDVDEGAAQVRARFGPQAWSRDKSPWPSQIATEWQKQEPKTASKTENDPNKIGSYAHTQRLLAERQKMEDDWRRDNAKAVTA